MNLLRELVLRLTVCGFLVALCSALFTSERLRRLVRFVGGCFLAVVVLQPLMDSELVSFLERLRPGLPESDYAEVQEKNDLLLKELVEQQTAEFIKQAARELGAELTITVTAQKDEPSGLFVPVRVTLRGFVTEVQRTALSERIERELAIGTLKQRWEIG